MPPSAGLASHRETFRRTGSFVADGHAVAGPRAAERRRPIPRHLQSDPAGGFVEQLRHFLLIPLGIGLVHPVLIFLARVEHPYAQDYRRAGNEETTTAHAYLPHP